MSGSHRAAGRRRTNAPSGADQAGAAPGPRARAGGRRRKPKRRSRALPGTAVVLAAAAAGWFVLGPGGAFAAHGRPSALPQAAPQQPGPGQSAAGPTAAASPDPHTETPAADRSDRADGTFAAIPGLGPTFAAKIPAEANQVVLASGSDKNSSTTTVTLWSRTPDGRWRPGVSWPAHNGDQGWSTDKRNGDLRSPIGVFTLSDAGGLKSDPGSKLPYHQDSDFVAGGTGFNGESLAGAFDYVVAIDYNRVTGSSPLDPREPLGTARGGGVWLHVDHGGPTHACVSIAEDHMAELVRTLDPAAHPVIVMGDTASLAT
ncbi:L,D-transpeptidase family protein [Kitasatospora acidiphila]|uniref:L,D-transpeptidase family protein n=1 Tax=Kitasatospora acidiphila TaxID=2567942 RepID=UPI003C7696D9